MKIKDILRGAATIAAPFIPGGPAIVAAVNAFLPDSEKLPDNSTGHQIEQKIADLPVEQRTAIYEKEIELEIVESNNFSANLNALAEVDKAGASTRPAIAREMAHIVSFSVIVLVSAIFVSIWNGDSDLIEEIKGAWPLVLAILGTPTALLRAYFGMRTKEKRARYLAGSGSPAQSGALSNILAMIRGK